MVEFSRLVLKALADRLSIEQVIAEVFRRSTLDRVLVLASHDANFWFCLVINLMVGVAPVVLQFLQACGESAGESQFSLPIASEGP